MKLLLLLLLLPLTTEAGIRYNNFTGYWEGNVCANLVSWSIVPYQPIGSVCQIILPNGMMAQGQIINR